MTLISTPPAGLLGRARTADWPRGWRAASGLTCVAAGAAVMAGAFLPWVEAFAGLIQVPGVRGLNGQILAAAGAVIIVAGLYQLARGGLAARWLAGLAGFAACGFSGYLLIELTRTMRALGGDDMVIARGGPGLWIAAAGSVAAFATLLLPTGTRRPAPVASAAPVPFTGSQRAGGQIWRRAVTWAADRESAGLRRGLQIALGLVWLVDAALQFQPYMFGRMFPGMMLASAGTGGEPAFVSGPVLGAARLFADAPAVWNALFATIQLALALGLLSRATARAALAGTVAWGLGVWWLGEGLGGLFTPAADPLTGAPGAAVLYALLAVLLWPRTAAGTASAGISVAAGSPLGRSASLAWFALWAGLAVLMLRAPSGAAPLTASGGAGAAAITITLAVAFALAAVGILVPVTARPAVLLAALAAAFVWVAGEHFGVLFSGTATDPNSGPLLLLIAAAFWPRRQR